MLLLLFDDTGNLLVFVFALLFDRLLFEDVFEVVLATLWFLGRGFCLLDDERVEAVAVLHEDVVVVVVWTLTPFPFSLLAIFDVVVVTLINSIAELTVVFVSPTILFMLTTSFSLSIFDMTCLLFSTIVYCFMIGLLFVVSASSLLLEAWWMCVSLCLKLVASNQFYIIK